MKVLRDDVVRLCEALNFKAAGQWKRQKMQDMLRRIAGTDGIQDSDVDGDNLRSLLNEIVALNGDVEVVRTAEELDDIPSESKAEPMEIVPAEETETGTETEVDSEQGEEPVSSVGEAESEDSIDAEDCVPIHEPKPPKKKRGRKKREESNGENPKTGNPKIMGKYSVGPFVRWMGSVGCDIYDVCRVLCGEKAKILSGITIVRELHERRKDHPLAEISEEDRVELQRKYPSVFAK